MRLVFHFQAEKAMLARKEQNPGPTLATRSSNIWAQQAGLPDPGCVLEAGWTGPLFPVAKPAWRVWQLELVNYIEHYGLTRNNSGEGKYEHVQPRHSLMPRILGVELAVIKSTTPFGHTTNRNPSVSRIPNHMATRPRHRSSLWLPIMTMGRDDALGAGGA